MKKIIGIFLLIISLSNKCALVPKNEALLRFSDTPIKVPLEEESTFNTYTEFSKELRIEMKSDILFDLCVYIFIDYMKKRYPQSVSSRRKEFSEKLNAIASFANDQYKTMEFAKSLISKFNIVQKGILSQNNLSYQNAYLLPIDTDYNYIDLQSLFFILLHIIHTTFISLPDEYINYQHPINDILKFVQDNLFKEIKIQKRELNNNNSFEIVENISELTENYVTKYSTPVIPYDAIIFLANILGAAGDKNIKDALRNLGEEKKLDSDYFENIFFKIEYLKNINFHFSYSDKHKTTFQNLVNPFSAINQKNKLPTFLVNHSFLNKYLLLLERQGEGYFTHGSFIDISKVTKEILIKMYKSALHIIFVSGYVVEDRYNLESDMSMIEICSMFLKLGSTIENNKLTKNVDKDGIEKFKKLVTSIKELFKIVYNKIDPLVSKTVPKGIPKDDYLYSYIKATGRTYDFTSEYSTSDLLFLIDKSVINDLKNETIFVERFDQYDLEILYKKLSDLWNDLVKENKSLVDIQFPTWEELNKEEGLNSVEKFKVQLQERDQPKKVKGINWLKDLFFSRLIPKNQRTEKQPSQESVQASTKTSLIKHTSNHEPQKKALTSATSSNTPSNHAKKEVSESWGSYVLSYINPWAWYNWYYKEW